jgi:glycosyltransferase involved in cell wall biosynthesis
MRVLFGTTRGHVPEQLGGSQQDMHALLQALLERGHHCEAVATIEPGPRLLLYRVLRRVSGRRRIGLRDRRNRYATYRAWYDQVPRLVGARLDAHRPDVFVADFRPDNEMVDEGLARGIPTLLRIVSVGSVERHVPISRHPLVQTYSNSAFVASRVRLRYGLESPIVYPLIDLDRYRTERRDPVFVTFFNPIAIKGLETVLEVAGRLPHRRFQIVEVLPLRGAALADLNARFAALPNVTFCRASQDVRPVYGRTLLLLAPSQVEEGFGRVVIEAQASGIPCVVRDVGGLGEAVGAGGVLMPPSATAAEWAEAIEAVLGDRRRLADLSAAAASNAARPEFSLQHNVERFIALATSHARAATPSRAAS